MGHNLLIIAVVIFTGCYTRTSLSTGLQQIVICSLTSLDSTEIIDLLCPKDDNFISIVRVYFGSKEENLCLDKCCEPTCGDCLTENDRSVDYLLTTCTGASSCSLSTQAIPPVHLRCGAKTESSYVVVLYECLQSRDEVTGASVRAQFDSLYCTNTDSTSSTRSTLKLSSSPSRSSKSVSTSSLTPNTPSSTKPTRPSKSSRGTSPSISSRSSTPSVTSSTRLRKSGTNPSVNQSSIPTTPYSITFSPDLSTAGDLSISSTPFQVTGSLTTKPESSSDHPTPTDANTKVSLNISTVGRSSTAQKSSPKATKTASPTSSSPISSPPISSSPTSSSPISSSPTSSSPISSSPISSSPTSSSPTPSTVTERPLSNQTRSYVTYTKSTESIAPRTSILDDRISNSSSTRSTKSESTSQPPTGSNQNTSGVPSDSRRTGSSSDNPNTAVFITEVGLQSEGPTTTDLTNPDLVTQPPSDITTLSSGLAQTDSSVSSKFGSSSSSSAVLPIVSDGPAAGVLTESPTTMTGQGDQGLDDVNIAIIAGICGVAGLLIIGLIIICYCNRTKKRERPPAAVITTKAPASDKQLKFEPVIKYEEEAGVDNMAANYSSFVVSDAEKSNLPVNGAAFIDEDSKKAMAEKEDIEPVYATVTKTKRTTAEQQAEHSVEYSNNFEEEHHHISARNIDVRNPPDGSSDELPRKSDDKDLDRVISVMTDQVSAVGEIGVVFAEESFQQNSKSFSSNDDEQSVNSSRPSVRFQDENEDYVYNHLHRQATASHAAVTTQRHQTTTHTTVQTQQYPSDHSGRIVARGIDIEPEILDAIPVRPRAHDHVATGMEHAFVDHKVTMGMRGPPREPTIETVILDDHGRIDQAYFNRSLEYSESLQGIPENAEPHWQVNKPSESIKLNQNSYDPKFFFGEKHAYQSRHDDSMEYTVASSMMPQYYHAHPGGYLTTRSASMAGSIGRDRSGSLDDSVFYGYAPSNSSIGSARSYVTHYPRRYMKRAYVTAEGLRLHKPLSMFELHKKKYTLPKRNMRAFNTPL